MDREYIEYIACLHLTSYHYKILLLLNVRPYNQAALSNILKSQRQSIYKCVKELEERNLIEVDRWEGRNKFYKAITDMKKLKNI